MVLKEKKNSCSKQLIRLLCKKKFKLKLKNSNIPPAKNRITNKLDINKIFVYSPKKNAAKVIAEYSTLYPATSSASASGKSKGARLVSANIEIKKINANGNNGKKNHIVWFWTYIIWFKFNELENSIIGIIIKLILTSYEIICETDRNEPNKAYFELELQPDNKIP